MFGLSRKWMLHATTSFSDFYSSRISWESARLYAKYRFYSNDDVHRHFRMAAFGEAAYSRSPFAFGELSLDGDNSGAQAGVMATQLINKLAVSATASVINAFANRMQHVDVLGHSIHAMYYSLSGGYLLFPVNYSSYQQTNGNLYLEIIGMKGFEKGDYMIDLAPAFQLIFNSNFKINLGARLQLASNMTRIGERSYFIALERTFLGALQHRKRAIAQ